MRTQVFLPFPSNSPSLKFPSYRFPSTTLLSVSGFRVLGVGFRVSGFRFRVSSLGFRVWYFGRQGLGRSMCPPCPSFRTPYRNPCSVSFLLSFPPHAGLVFNVICPGSLNGTVLCWSFRSTINDLQEKRGGGRFLAKKSPDPHDPNRPLQRADERKGEFWQALVRIIQGGVRRLANRNIAPKCGTHPA